MTTVNPIPKPSSNLKIKIVDLPAKTILYRVHPKRFGPVQFNDSGTGNARFSPIYDSTSKIIPTIYAAKTLDAALMETVFHDVATSTGLKIFDSRKLDVMAHCVIMNSSNLKLAALHGAALRGLGIEERDLIHSAAADYRETREWAMAIHAQHPDVQGLVWTSKQCSPEFAYVFFGDRCPTDIFSAPLSSPDLNGQHCVGVINGLADDMGVMLTLR